MHTDLTRALAARLRTHCPPAGASDDAWETLAADVLDFIKSGTPASYATVHELPDTDAGSDGMTARQRVILNQIRDTMHARGYPPSIRELCASAGLSSPSSVVHHLRRLEELGYLRRHPHAARAVEVLA